MQILPNGKVQIKNNQTGEVKEVDPIELPKYGGNLVTQYQTLKSQPTVSPTPSTATQPVADPEQAVKKSLSQQVGEGAINIGKSLTEPFIRTGKNIYGAAEEYQRGQALNKVTGGGGLDVSMTKGQGTYGDNTSLLKIEKNKSIDDLIKQQQEISKKLREETDPAKKNKLIEQSRAISGKLEGRSEALGNLTKPGVMSESELSDPRKMAVQQLKDSANIASWAVPFGKGGNLATKAVLPGAAVGTLQGLSKDEVTPESVVGDAVLGAAGGTVLHGLSKIPGALKGAGKTTEGIGEAISADVSKIRVKPSVYGAAEEKTIQKTLKDLGIKGSPQKQYEMLQPKMEELSNDIADNLARNSKPVDTNEVVKHFNENIKSALRSKEITQKSAQIEMKGYLDDLLQLEGKGSDLSSSDLFALKKHVNQDYGPIDKKIWNNIPLNDREKVIAAMRKSLDDTITSLHPEIKAKTLQQSNLYEAALSLARQRDTVPTVRIAGTTLPAQVIHTGQDMLGRTVEGTGKLIEGTGNILPNIPDYASGQLGSRALLQNPSDQTDQENGSVADNSSGNNQGGQMDHIISPNGQSNNTDIIPDGSTLPNIPQTLNPYGATPEIIYREYQNALNAGDTKTANRLKSMYTDEVAYQKTNNTTGKPKSAAGLQVEGKAKAGLNALKTIESMVSSDPAVLVKAAVPGSPGARQYEAAISSITDAIGGLRTGATVSKDQQKFYRNMLPKIGDSPETIAKKMKDVRAELENYVQGAGNIQDPLTLPDITGGT